MQSGRRSETMLLANARASLRPLFPGTKTESHTLTLTLSRFAVEGTRSRSGADGVPSPAKRERVRVRDCGSVSRNNRNKNPVRRNPTETQLADNPRRSNARTPAAITRRKGVALPRATRRR